MIKLSEITKKIDSQFYEVKEDYTTFYNIYDKELEIVFGVNDDIIVNDDEEPIEDDFIHDFINSKYILGQSILRDNYYEIVIDFNNILDYYDLDALEIKGCGDDYLNKTYYEIGALSLEFGEFLKQSIHWEHFSPEYYQSIKIYNLNKLIPGNCNEELFIKNANDYVSIILFQISTHHGLNIKRLDLSDSDTYDPDMEEFDSESISSTIIEPYNYDIDLINYYNRANLMSNDSFKYLAFFQVIECLFDEVFRDQTIQDAKAIINSNWFNSHNSENVLELIKLVEKFSKEQNDRNKIRLVLEKYFKMNMHEEAFLLAYSDISDILLELKLIKDEKEINDIQKVGNIIYDIRCEYTHSNRAFDKRKETKIDEEDLSNHIELIKLISKAIIENYTKK